MPWVASACADELTSSTRAQTFGVPYVRPPSPPHLLFACAFTDLSSSLTPQNNSFSYPNVSGYSFSFTEDGYFEQAQFTWNANATDPHCIEAVVIWQHGTYEVLGNGSITTNSSVFAGDGRIQVRRRSLARGPALALDGRSSLSVSKTRSRSSPPRTGPERVQGRLVHVRLLLAGGPVPVVDREPVARQDDAPTLAVCVPRRLSAASAASFAGSSVQPATCGCGLW